MQGIFDFIAYHTLRLLSAFFSTLPYGLSLRIGAFAGFIFYLFAGRRRQSAYADLKSAFGSSLTEKQRWGIVRKHYQHLAQTAIEIIRFPALNREFIERYLHIHDQEKFFDLIKEDQGAILLTAHFGNWELLQIVSGIFGKPIHALAREQKHTRLNELLIKLRESHGSVAISRGIGVRHLLRALHRKGLVGVVGDQDAGKYEGLILRFLGRKTTVPTGAFELAKRTGAPILPCFIVRNEKPGALGHDIYVEEPIRCGKGKYQEEDLEPFMKRFVGLLENFIRKNPSQWLWASKRWKHSWTKRLLVLSDGKAGHVKQSEALVEQFHALNTQYGRPGMEYPTQTLLVKFKSNWHRKLFSIFAFFFIPFAQGRLDWIGWYFEEETRKAIREASADFIISAGSSLIPLNLCLAKECRAKSIVLMKPILPFTFFRYDMALVPAHDSGPMPSETFRTLLTPSRTDEDEFEAAAQKIRKDLHDPSRVRISLFLGGPTRQYQMELKDIQQVMETLEKVSGVTGDYLVTTSRRTPDSINQFLKTSRPQFKGCQMLVIAAEDKRTEVVSGMMALADILIVTEDSISMISEAVSSGKKVLVLSFGGEGLPPKHKRFQEILAQKSAVLIATPENLQKKIVEMDQKFEPQDIVQEEQDALQKRLQEIL